MGGKNSKAPKLVPTNVQSQEKRARIDQIVDRKLEVTALVDRILLDRFGNSSSSPWKMRVLKAVQASPTPEDEMHRLCDAAIEIALRDTLKTVNTIQAHVQELEAEYLKALDTLEAADKRKLEIRVAITGKLELIRAYDEVRAPGSSLYRICDGLQLEIRAMDRELHIIAHHPELKTVTKVTAAVTSLVVAVTKHGKWVTRSQHAKYHTAAPMVDIRTIVPERLHRLHRLL